ncbi:hypothetical protein AAFF_G00168930 [Aldrovandia affinis]|uniref:PH domain-containing protein n=1 Tax=Aldrovandia affinis TaxID=143900 RepID=A0AAD7RLX5_9TELE|nr:hypothetical protein AAFF_G00168930 [Aldrovandia affinis]
MPGTQRNPGPNAVFYKTVAGVDEVQTGYLIKSPPSKKFKSLRSWKRRFFVLFKTSEKGHSLKYFRSAEDRDKPLGSIELSQISLIFSSPKSHSKWSWIHKAFKCPPNSVLFIQAANRDYFLIDENNDNVENWLQDISKARSSHSDSLLNPEKLTQLTNIPTIAFWQGQKQGSELCDWWRPGSGRSFSDPVHPVNITQYTSQNTDYGRPRPISDPVSKLDLSHIGEQTSCRSQTEEGYEKHCPVSDAMSQQDLFYFRTQSCSSEGSSSSERSASEPFPNASQESHYDTPKNIFKGMRQVSENGDDAEDKEWNKEGANSLYMTMDTVYEVVIANQQRKEEISAASGTAEEEGLEDPEDGLLESVISALEEQKLHTAPRVEEQDEYSEREEPQPPSSPNEEAKVSQVDILLNRMMKRSSTTSRSETQNHNGSSDRDVADVREIYVNRNDLKTHLTLGKEDGKPCVSHWLAQPGTRCLFHKGDQILAVNDLLTESVEEVQTYLNKLLKNQVKLTVQRRPGSKAFLSSRWGTE